MGREITIGGMISGGWGRAMLALMCGVALALAMTAVFANPAKAAELTVTNTNDSGSGSLRDAINTANGNNQTDTITFELPDNSTITLTSGQLTIRADSGNTSSGNALTIDGPGARQLSVSGDDRSRVFNVNGGADVTIEGLTIKDGTVTGVGLGAGGGGIFSSTPSASSSNPNPSERTTITNSTISGNTASDRGGGLRNFNGLTVIENSTITQNTAPDNQGAGVASFGDNATRTDVRASIISNNTATDVDFVPGSNNSFNSMGSNIVGDGNATNAFDKRGDEVGVADPRLGPLANNGGPTKTHAVRSNSPALDGVVGSCDVARDQRGVKRPQDGDNNGRARCDVGSFELEASPSPNNPKPDKPKPDNPKPKPPAKKNPNACTIKGNNKDNVLRGTAKRDVICGFGGNDIIRGLGGNDLIKGGFGNDVIYGNNGNDKLLGQGGNDALFGGNGRDVLLGGSGKNTLIGGPGKDVEKGGVSPSKSAKQTKKLINNIFKQVGLR